MHCNAATFHWRRKHENGGWILHNENMQTNGAQKRISKLDDYFRENNSKETQRSFGWEKTPTVKESQERESSSFKTHVQIDIILAYYLFRPKIEENK